ncbi:MAG: hypothetical protein RIR39_1968 [Pseudomonadota bacterium]|jgi:hypothetical protein
MLRKQKKVVIRTMIYPMDRQVIIEAGISVGRAIEIAAELIREKLKGENNERV